MESNAIAYLITNMFWMYIIFRFYNCFFEQKSKRLPLFFTYLLLYIINSSLYLVFHSPLLNLCSSILGLYSITLNYTASVFRKLLSIALIYTLSMLCDISVVVGFYTYYPGLKLNALNTFFAYFFLLILEIIIERIVNLKKTTTLKTCHWSALIAVPLASIFILCMMVSSPVLRKGVLLSIVFTLLFINSMIFYLYDSIQHIYIKEMKEDFLHSQLHAYKEQLDIMIQSQNRIHSLQHDLKHHLSAIHAFALQGNSDDIRSYIHKMQASIERSELLVFTTNPIINSILNYMLRDDQDSLDLDIHILIPDDLSADMFDISVVLGNLLDNALRASLHSIDKYLSVHISCDKGLFHLCIQNSYCQPLVSKNGIFQSTQSHDEMHGIGLPNVEAVIAQRQGLIEYHYDETRFSVSVLLYLSNV